MSDFTFCKIVSSGMYWVFTLLWVLVTTLFCVIISKKKKEERWGFKEIVEKTMVLNDGIIYSEVEFFALNSAHPELSV